MNTHDRCLQQRDCKKQKKGDGTACASYVESNATEIMAGVHEVETPPEVDRCNRNEQTPDLDCVSLPQESVSPMLLAEGEEANEAQSSEASASYGGEQVTLLSAYLRT